MQLNIAKPGNTAASTVEVSDVAFAREFNGDLIHQVVTAFLNAARQGTKAQKNRSAVSGGGAKPFRQKGTGRARAGTTRGPIWRSGGVNFAAQPRNYEQKVNKKMYRAAMQSILSELARSERLLVVEEFSVEAPKTKQLVAKLKELDVDSALLITEEVDMNLFLSARNLHKVEVVDVAGLNPVSLISRDKVVVTVAALKKIEELLG